MLRPRSAVILQRRWKHAKDHWSMQRKKTFPKDRALENFDDFYGSVFGIRWRNMRAALLTAHKYVALVNNFGDTEETIQALEADGAINIRSLYNASKERLKTNDNQPMFKKDSTFKIDERLSGFIEKHEGQEISSLYPKEYQEFNQLPSKVEYNQITQLDKVEQTKEDQVDYKKSLHDVSRDDSEIDFQRIVDPAYGTGALYQFVPATRIKGREDWIPESEHYKYYSNETDFPVRGELEEDFTYPEHLQMFTYEMGNCSTFIPPKMCVTGVLSHYLMDGASILPPLLLNVLKGERVLDACCAPGGKSLLMLQTLHPDVLICNDVQESRANRIKKIMNEYIYDFDDKWKGERCIITQSDARAIDTPELYDKILVDVPCTNDRHSLMENDNNIFKPSRVKERLRIPELQSAILTNCLRLLKPGGSLVYSTCSLSPIQNDGVVHMALQKAFLDYGITTTIKDLSKLIEHFRDIFRFENPSGLKYGQMVIPYLPANFGPMYFCKITRNHRL